MSEHTPGPWFVSMINTTTHGGVTFSRATVDAVQVGRRVCVVEGSCSTDQMATKATARVIAAAPDMLEALVAVDTMADLFSVETGGPFDKVRKAIAKAKGDAS